MAEFIGHCSGKAKIPLLEGGGAVFAQTGLRQTGKLGAETLGLPAGLTSGHDPVCQPERERLLRSDRPSGEDHVHGARVADQPG